MTDSYWKLCKSCGNETEIDNSDLLIPHKEYVIVCNHCRAELVKRLGYGDKDEK